MKENYILKDQQEPEYFLQCCRRTRTPNMQCLGMIITTADDENTKHNLKRIMCPRVSIRIEIKNVSP